MSLLLLLGPLTEVGGASSIWIVHPPSIGTWANDNELFDSAIFDAGVFDGPATTVWTVKAASAAAWVPPSEYAEPFDDAIFDPALFDMPGGWEVIEPATGTWG
jgi:hypothetical protein